MQKLDPLAFVPVRAPPRYVFHATGVHQARLDPVLLQHIVGRNPVHPRALHGYRRDATTHQPPGHRLQIFGERRKHPHRILVPVRRHGYKDLPRTDIDPACIRVAAQAYNNIVGRALFLNLLPLLLVFLALLAVERNFRRAALPILPTAIAAGWAPLILLVLGLVPGGVGKTLGAFNPLTVVLGALVVALATEFGVVLLRRFDEECARGVHPDEAAAIALGGTGRAVGV